MKYEDYALNYHGETPLNTFKEISWGSKDIKWDGQLDLHKIMNTINDKCAGKIDNIFFINFFKVYITDYDQNENIVLWGM